MQMTDTTPARELVGRALLPLRAVSDDLHASAVAYVLDSTDPQALPHIPAQSDVRRLLNNPGRIEPDVELSAQMRRRLHAAGVSAPERHAGPEPGEPEEESLVRSLRALLYLRGSLTPEQWERFGRLLIALGDAPNRCAAGVPEWLCALLNDVTVTAACARYMLPPGESEKRSAQELRERWSPTAVAALFEATGAPAEQVPAVILLAWIAEANGGYVYASAEEPKYCLPGIEDYLAAHDGQIPADALTALSARARADIAKRLGAHPQAAAGCPRFLAMLAVDSAATVRRAAIAVLDELPARARDAALVEQLATARTPRLKEAVTWLASTPAGERILEEVVAVNPAAARLARSLTERRDTLLAKADSERVPDVLDLPPFDSALDVPSAASVKAALRRRITARIQELTDVDSLYLKSQRHELEKITDDVLDRIVAIADGTSDEPLGISGGHAIWDELLTCPELRLLHLCRLQAHADDPSVTRLLYGDVARRLDPRTVEQALLEAGLPIGTDFVQWAWQWHDPGQIWAWAATHPDLVGERLRDTSDAVDALRALELFPVLPAQLLPAVADAAVDAAATNRRLAQRVLRTHPGARELAERSLTGTASTREAAAQWLADLADPAAIPALRRAAAKERTPAARAAILHALVACGEDAGDLLSPEVLGAEAAKGLRSKPPASLDWLDFDALPPLRWRDGGAVTPEIVRWWVIMADKLKDPSGRGLWELYLDRLEPADAAALGSHILQAWIAQDTRGLSEDECRTRAQTAGRQEYDACQRYLARTKEPEWLVERARQEAAVPLEEHVARALRHYRGLFVGSAIADKGLLALTVRMDGTELADAVSAYMRQAQRPQGGHRAQLAALLAALAANGHPDALALLQATASRHKMRTIQKTAVGLVEQVAQWRGWSAEELADRTVPTGGLDPDGLLRLSYGEREFTGRLTPELRIVLTDSSGKTLKTLPEARVSESSLNADAAKKQLRTARKDAKAVLTLQSARLYEAMCGGRTWTGADWRTLLRGHPLVGLLVTRLVWLMTPAGGGEQVAFRPVEDGALLDADDAIVELSDEAVIRLAHGTLMGSREVAAWRDHLADYQVDPLFDQLTATAPQVETGASRVDDFSGRPTTALVLRRAATGRGYRHGQTVSGPWFVDYTKDFTSLGLTAVLGFSGADLPEGETRCTLGGLSFRRGHRETLPAEVPPVLLAECHADYRAVADAVADTDPGRRCRERSHHGDGSGKAPA